MSLDISNFYLMLMAPMDRYKYVRMNLSDFPEEIINSFPAMVPYMAPP